MIDISTSENASCIVILKSINKTDVMLFDTNIKNTIKYPT